MRGARRLREVDGVEKGTRMDGRGSRSACRFGKSRARNRRDGSANGTRGSSGVRARCRALRAARRFSKGHALIVLTRGATVDTAVARSPGCLALAQHQTGAHRLRDEVRPRARAGFHHRVVDVGAHCVVGGNALVNKDIEDNLVAFGVPVKVIRKRVLGEKYL